MKIAMGSDHAGFRYKERIKTHLQEHGHQILDFGAFSDESSDYPDFVRPAAECVARSEADAGIVLGGSGNGEAMVANKVRGVRCAVCWSRQTAEWAKTHNNANVISIGERTVTPEMALQIVDTWLSSVFQGGRHERRVGKIENG
ncbi:ribose 5-phosphate isomerase B [bacterium]|nr:ribose 5-phosphate isomerase B [bacterium]